MTNQTKVCVKCNTELPVTKFTKASGGNYFRTECNLCRSSASKMLKQVRGSIPPPTNDYVCPICNKLEDDLTDKGNKYQTSPWALDHNHSSGKIRGWLCHSCNRALGGFKDDEETLRRAVIYLKDAKD